MERYHKPGDRNQLSFQAVSLDDMLPENAEVRSLEAIIDHMDIASLGFCHAKTKQTGRKPYDPVDMFKIYAYSYFNGIRSSRKIERECYRNIELMWLVNGIRPDHKTIANFRKDNKATITQAFKSFGLLCSRLGLIGKEMVAIDGSKFRACNSRDACYSKGKIENMLEYHGKLVAKYIKLLDSTDEQEFGMPQPTREEIIQRLEHSEQRLVELSLMKAEVLENGTIYETDKDARLMKSSNNGVNISHNVQIAVDDKHHLVVAVDVTSQPVDKEQLYSMASQAKQQLGTDALTVLADKGYQRVQKVHRGWHHTNCIKSYPQKPVC